MEFVGSFLAGLAVEALVGAVQAVRDRGARAHRHTTTTELRRRFRPTADQLALRLTQRLDDHRIPRDEQARIATMLRRPEGQILLRQTMVAVLTGQEAEHRVDLQAQVVALLALLVEIQRPRAEVAGSILYDVLRAACEQLVEQTARNAEHFTALRSEAWDQLLLDGLRAIPQATARYSVYTLSDIRAFEEFERLYRAAVHARHRSITPPHHHQQVRPVPLQKLFVEPELRTVGGSAEAGVSTGAIPVHRGGEGDQRRLITLKELRERGHCVVLGDPGGGKSTLALKIAYDLSNPNHAQRRCPIHVTLRDYAQWEATNGGSIAEYIATRARGHYQVIPPPGAVEYLLLSGRAFVILDGLDELLDAARRQEVVANVESFAHRYPDAPILVTSRRAGYHQAPLDPEVFEEIELGELGDPAIKDYVFKWFALDRSKTPDERASLARSFLSQSRQVADLRRNPLLLALLCNVFRAESYIPPSRLEVYRSCAMMLFEKWDRQRNIRVDLPYRSHLEPAIRHLAHWIYADERLQSGITEAQLITKTVEYLYPDRIDDAEEALEVAQAFVLFCNGRAWVFSDIGSTSKGLTLYQFTHRTFLEYFAAGYLVRVSHTAADLWQLLLPRILHQEWDVVAELSLPMKDEQEEGAADVFLASLLEESRRRGGPELINLLSFAARCLHILVPGQRTIRTVVNRCVDFMVSREADNTRYWSFHGEVAHLLEELLAVRNENRPVVVRTTIDRLGSITNIMKVRDAATAAAIGLTIRQQWEIRPEVGDEWQGADAAVMAALGANLLAVATADIRLAMLLHRRGELSTLELVQAHGLETMFSPAAASGAGRKNHHVCPDRYPLLRLAVQRSGHDASEAGVEARLEAARPRTRNRDSQYGATVHQTQREPRSGAA